MKNPERTNFNDVILGNIDMEIAINNFLSTPTLTHNHGNPNDMTIKSNHNVSHIEKIENYNELSLEWLKQSMKNVLKQYPPTSNNLPTCSVMSSMKDHIDRLES